VRHKVFISNFGCFVASLTLASGCSGNASSGGSSGSGASGASNSSSAPAVSFAQDIMPIFQNDCSTANGGACHGVTTVTTQVQPRPYLGPYLTPLDGGIIDQVYMGLVNVDSNEAPKMPYVDPGNLANSFLWHKVDGDLTSIMADCTNPISTVDPCGAQMPDTSLMVSGVAALPASSQAEIASWIDAGAPNN